MLKRISLALAPLCALLPAAAYSQALPLPAVRGLDLRGGITCTGATCDASPLSVMPNGGTTSRSLRTRFADTIMAADRGVVCDGTTDIGPAMAALFGSLGGNKPNTIQMPPGVCLWNTAVTATSTFILRGYGAAEIGDSRGTLLVQSNTAITPLTMTGIGASQTVNGSVIHDLAFQQVQPAPSGSSWTPTIYPPFFVLSGAPGITFRDVLGYGVDKGISADGSGRLDLNGLRGQFFSYAASLDRMYDTVLADRVHVWPYWNSDSRVVAYQLANSDGIVSARNDNPRFGRMVFWGVKNGIHLTKSSTDNGAGVTVKMSIDALDVDESTTMIYVDDAVNGASVDVSAAYVQGSATPVSTAPLLRVGGSNNSLYFGKSRFTHANGAAATVVGTANSVTFADTGVDDFNNANTGQTAFQADTTGGNRIDFTGTFRHPGVNNAPLVVGNITGILGRGRVTGTTDGAGRILGVSHNAGQTPPNIRIPYLSGGGAGYTAAGINQGPSTFDLYVYKADGTAAPGVAVTADFEARP